MPASDSSLIEVDGHQVDLRNRALAAVLAWLLPGAGHLYQRRYAKGSLYLSTILATWIIGFAIGGGHVVYASWAPGDRRWHYLCQLGVGGPSLPALVQGNRMRTHTDPATGETVDGYEPLWGGFMAPPHRPVIEERADEVAAWYARSGAGYEMGTWYTMIAGLLNILVIYDAYLGPLAIPISGRKKQTSDTTDSDAAAGDPGAAASPAAASPSAATPSDAASAPAAEKR
jgi:hypothetical protein